jgi:phytoene desaturase
MSNNSSAKEIIVIGSGFGGLSAAIRLASAGHRVTILEKRDKIGGRAYQYEVNGFQFDGGPTVITAPYMFDELFALGDRNREDYFQLKSIDPFYRIFDENGRQFTYHRELEKAKKEVAKISPEDVAGYERFVQSSIKIFEKYHPLTEKPFLKLKQMLDIIPGSLKLGTYLPTYHYASRYVKDEFLRRICSFHPLLIGGSPFDTPAIFDLIIQFEKEWGIHYPRGGTGAIVNALGTLFEELGGRIELNTEVSEIILKDGRATGVQLKDGRVYKAEEVVCNGDVAFAYKHLIPKKHRPAKIDLYIDNMAYSNSLVVIYFGTKRRYLDSQLSHHNIIFNKDYRKLLRGIFKGQPLSDDLCLYLHMPTITDESIAPEGCESFYVLSLVPHLDANIDWDTIGPEYNDKILGFLEENYLPDLRQNIIAQHSINPVHFRDTLNSYKGAAFSVKPSLIQSGWMRPHTKSTFYDNLYFVGAGTHPGAGVPAVIASGKIAAEMIDPVAGRTPEIALEKKLTSVLS